MDPKFCGEIGEKPSCPSKHEMRLGSLAGFFMPHFHSPKLCPTYEVITVMLLVPGRLSP